MEQTSQKTYLHRGEARTKRLTELFPWNKKCTREEILGILKKDGMIGSGLLGRLKGESIIRMIQPGNKYPLGVDPHYFFKDKETGKYSFTYTGEKMSTDF